MIEVFQGDFRELYRVISPEDRMVTAIDLFDKKDLRGIAQIKTD